MEELLQNKEFWSLVISLLALVISVFRPALADLVNKIKAMWFNYIGEEPKG